MAYERAARLDLVPEAEILTKAWWLVVLRGAAAIIFGLLTFFAPGISLLVLILMFGVYAVADGLFTVWAAAGRRGRGRRWVLWIQGLAGIAAGVIALFWPGITALALLYVIAAWALVIGGLEIAAAIQLRKVITNEWLLALSGLVSVALGVALMAAPGPGALALVLWIGAYAFVSGILLMVLGFRLHSWAQREPRESAA